MLPIFLELGYKIDEFILDYTQNKLTDENISFLKCQFKIESIFRTRYNAAGIDYYIGKYFAVKACPNQTYNYSIQLKELKQIDPDLFNILESFWESWGNYDYTEKFANHHSFLINFTEGLERWVTDKKITY
jgi:hypothetical protein